MSQEYSKKYVLGVAATSKAAERWAPKFRMQSSRTFPILATVTPPPPRKQGSCFRFKDFFSFQNFQVLEILSPPFFVLATLLSRKYEWYLFEQSISWGYFANSKLTNQNEAKRRSAFCHAFDMFDTQHFSSVFIGCFPFETSFALVGHSVVSILFGFRSFVLVIIEMKMR